MTQQDRYWQAKKITLLGAFSNGFLGVIKVIGGYFFHSHALIADGIHSFSDLLTDIMVLIASKYGSHDADDSHPYGHQRIETAATLFLSLLLSVAGVGIAWDSLHILLQKTIYKPDWLSIPIICMSILLNELLFHYSRFIGMQIKSSLIIANAWHHRSDAASSVVVLIGLLGSLLGIHYLDAVAAVIVGFMIIKMGWDYGWNSIKELVDTAVSPELLQEIEQTIKSVDGVQKVHQLRSRTMGSDIFVDVHILVNPKITVSEGHYIAQHVHQALVTHIAHIKDVTVHVDPEDDELLNPSMHLPSRSALNQQLFHELCLNVPDLLFWNIHYLNNHISIDIVCTEQFNQWDRLHHQIVETLGLQINIKEINLLTLHATEHSKIHSIAPQCPK